MRTIIENKKIPDLWQSIREIGAYRELLWTLAWKDIRVRYAQTLLGFGWAIIEPLLSAIILSLIFNKVAQASTLGVQPILFSMTGMISWNYFANVVSQGNTSLIMSQNMIKKIYFPRIIIPMSKALAALPDLGITLVFTTILWAVFSPSAGWNLLWFPLFVLLTIMTAAASGVWFSALNIRFRDFVHILPFLIRLGMFVTPIAYSYTAVPENYRWIFFLNPMTGIIEGMRWSILGLPFPQTYFMISMAVILILVPGSWFFFYRLEKNLADIL